MYQIIIAIYKWELDALTLALTASAKKHECTILVTNEVADNPDMLQVTVQSQSLYGLFELGMSFALLSKNNPSANRVLN